MISRSWLVCLLVLAACDASAAVGDRARRDAGSDANAATDAAVERADAASIADLPAFCARGASDAVAQAFCEPGVRAPTGLAQLRQRLRLSYAIFLAHSTGLGNRTVSSINPRVLIISGGSLGAKNAGFAALAFARGQQRVELIALDPVTRRFNLYLLEFRQTCNASAEGCQPGDLYTPAIENDWLEVRIRDDEDLKNAPQDCRRCHAGAPDQPKPMLLMRELRAPWTHWMLDTSVLREDFLAAKATPGARAFLAAEASEAYAGVGVDTAVNAGALEQLIDAAEREGLQAAQPLLFPSAEVGFETGERPGANPLLPIRVPNDAKLARSPTWQALYTAFLAGAAAAPPYQYERITDPAKLAASALSYQAYLRGESQHELPDLSDVYPDDPQRLAELGFGIEPTATGPQLLQQACAACHNQTLDQSVSRARFDADLSQIGREGFERAIERLQLPAADPRRMPPADGRELSAGARERLVEYLRSAMP